MRSASAWYSGIPASPLNGKETRVEGPVTRVQRENRLGTGLAQLPRQRCTRAGPVSPVSSRAGMGNARTVTLD